MIAVVLTTGLADAYNLANTAPNVVYDLIIGGILAATLVPVLVSATEDGDTKALNAVATVVTVALIGVTVLGLVAAPWIVRMYTFTLDPAARAAQEEVAVPLLRLFIPQVLFYGLTALFSAMLNARRRFAAAAFAPVKEGFEAYVQWANETELIPGLTIELTIADDQACALACRR